MAPGTTWSFNGTTGERTAEKGFQTAPVIINGKHEDQLGGGICQIATCIFNAACFSGLGIAERVNHDFYISSYDDYGFADATVSWKSPDLKWVNDMSTYVLMTATVTDEDVVITFWGTKDGRTVECQRGEWKEGDKYVTITEVDPALATGESKVTQNGQVASRIDIRYLAKVPTARCCTTSTSIRSTRPKTRSSPSARTRRRRPRAHLRLSNGIEGARRPVIWTGTIQEGKKVWHTKTKSPTWSGASSRPCNSSA